MQILSGRLRVGPGLWLGEGDQGGWWRSPRKDKLQEAVSSKPGWVQAEAGGFGLGAWTGH